MSKMKGPEVNAKMIELLRRWQGIERRSIEVAGQMIEKTQNSTLQLVAEILRHDSTMHHRVQQILTESLSRGDAPLTHDELGQIWDLIEKHDAGEKEVVALGKELQEMASHPAHKMILAYLITDEEKHDRLLESLSEIKRAMSRTTQ
jgi:hypothetical protein